MSDSEQRREPPEVRPKRSTQGIPPVRYGFELDDDIPIRRPAKKARTSVRTGTDIAATLIHSEFNQSEIPKPVKTASVGSIRKAKPNKKGKSTAKSDTDFPSVHSGLDNMFEVPKFTTQSSVKSPSKVKSSVGSRSSKEYKDKLLLQAETAKLKAMHAKQKAQVDIQLATLRAKHETEMAELEAQVLQSMIISSQHTDNNSETELPDKSKAVHDWIETQVNQNNTLQERQSEITEETDRYSQISEQSKEIEEQHQAQLRDEQTQPIDQEAQLKYKQQAQLREQQAQFIYRRQAQLKYRQAQLRGEQQAQLLQRQEAQLRYRQQAQLRDEQQAQLRDEQQAQLRYRQQAQLRDEQQAQFRDEQQAQFRDEQQAQQPHKQEAQLRDDQQAQLRYSQQTQLREQQAHFRYREQVQGEERPQALFRDGLQDRLQGRDRTQARQTRIQNGSCIDSWIDDLIIGEETHLQWENEPIADQIAHALIKVESDRDLPRVDIPRFNGSALQWPKFIEQFYYHIHSRKGINDARRMDVLQSHLEGEAKQLVEGLGYSGRHYALALKELKRSFGHRMKVARAFIEKITNGPVLNSHDAQALRKLYISLRDCITTLQLMNYDSDLSSSEIVFKVARRLPADMVARWNEHVRLLAATHDPTLPDLLDWMRDRVEADNNPFAISQRKQSRSQYTKAEDKQSTVYNMKGNTLSKKVQGYGMPQQSKSPTPQSTSSKCPSPPNYTKVPCHMCSEGHYLYRCPLFANKTVDERKDIVRQNNLCFNCLKPYHGVMKCFSAICCQEPGCQRRHHTMLHQEPRKPMTERVTNRKVLSRNDFSVLLQIVPVIVFGQSGRIKKTFALLDSGSDVTLIQSSLAEDLCLKGKNETLSMNTLNGSAKQSSQKIQLRIKGTDVESKILLVKGAWTYSGTFECKSQKVDPKWKHIAHLNLPDVDSTQIQLLIGLDTPQAHLQEDVISGDSELPYAVKTPLGWSLMGTSIHNESLQTTQARVNFIVTEDQCLQDQMEHFWKTESFGTKYNMEEAISVEDRKAKTILEETATLIDGHYQIDMLWRRNDIQLPDNYPYARKRYNLLMKKLDRSDQFEEMYSNTLNQYIDKGYATKVDDGESPDDPHQNNLRTWYIPHHGVQNPNKPGKVRVVFDAAAYYKGTSLNSNLMCGPDLVNSLFGILQRFRFYGIAIAADIEAMYHQVKVPEHDSHSLRFLWKAKRNDPGPPDIYKMDVHIFGATDSSACANYAVKRTALDNTEHFSPHVIHTVLHDFYVDDLLKSVEIPSQAIELAQDLTTLMEKGGFHLHKWISNSSEVLSSIPETERATQALDLDLDEFPIQRALGLRWNVNEDCFVYNSIQASTPSTKRSIVSTVSSIFDPCGYLTPFTMQAKVIIQELWRQNVDWDEELPTMIQRKWEEWLDELDNLTTFKLQRHHKSFTTEVENIQVHVFSDASEKAFGAVAYLRYATSSTDIHCSFLASKTRISPLKPVLSIPRLELQGALLALRLGKSLLKALSLPDITLTLWTDSITVLQYLNNEMKRFKPFVANRIAEILESSQPAQWRHISGSQNPADYCTRGMTIAHLTGSSSWFSAPDFLRNSEDTWPSSELKPSSLEDDPEIKTKHVFTTSSNKYMQSPCQVEPELSEILNPFDFSSWRRLLRLSAWIRRAVLNFKSKLSAKSHESINAPTLTVQECKDAAMYWIQRAQIDSFKTEIDILKRDKELNTTSRLLLLSPFFDGTHLRVGGRLRKANIPIEAKHQLILPNGHPVTMLLLEDIHKHTAHGGVEHVIASVRQKFWPLNLRRQVKAVIKNCRDCHKRRVLPSSPKMADLPVCRSNFDAPFIHTGIDYFGPMLVKHKRSRLKKWGCIFTCLVTRATHIELADSLETDNFILILRNFIGRRGNPGHIYSDNGTNFRGASNELSESIRNLNQTEISNFLTTKSTQWHFTPPYSPHFGGAWERLIRSIKIALKAVLHDKYVTESVLRTTLIEIEAVLNSRPLTYNSTDPEDFTPLTPNHFLIGRANPGQPIGSFDQADLCSRRRWRQSQIIADHVVKRWRREYLPTLTIRQKWRRESPNVAEGDLVTLMDLNKPRALWDMARVLQIYPGDDGRVRSVRVKTPRGEYTRPASKVCLLEEAVTVYDKRL